MSARVIPSEFVRQLTSLSWKEVLWGYEHQLLGWSAPVDVAIDQLLQGSTDPVKIELAGIQKNDAHSIGTLVQKLAGAELPQPEGTAQRKWLFLLLAWIFEHRTEIDDPLGEVEAIYADFDYPKEIENFVRHMPETGGYNPRDHTREDNEIRLFELWKNYLANARVEFGKKPESRTD